MLGRTGWCCFWAASLLHGVVLGHACSVCAWTDTVTTASLPGTTVLEGLSLGELVTSSALPVAPVNHLFGSCCLGLGKWVKASGMETTRSRTGCPMSDCKMLEVLKMRRSCCGVRHVRPNICSPKLHPGAWEGEEVAGMLGTAPFSEVVFWYVSGARNLPSAVEVDAEGVQRGWLCPALWGNLLPLPQGTTGCPCPRGWLPIVCQGAEQDFCRLLGLLLPCHFWLVCCCCGLGHGLVRPGKSRLVLPGPSVSTALQPRLGAGRLWEAEPAAR